MDISMYVRACPGATTPHRRGETRQEWAERAVLVAQARIARLVRRRLALAA